MKNNIAFLLFFSVLLFAECHSHSSKQFSFLHSLTDSLSVDTSKNVLIYTLNPNDCINCLNNFVNINNKLAQTKNFKLYVISVEREIEKNELMNTVTTIDLKDTVNNHVIWDKQLFDKISKLKNINIASSMLTVYNYAADSILFSKRIRDIEDVTELEIYTGK
jgi:viroplasmin and RNaseH domain-containing protein